MKITRYDAPAEPVRIASLAVRSRPLPCARLLFTQELPTIAQTPSRTASNVTLTAAQRQNIRLYTVAPSKFHKTIETTGAVDFDNDQATSVLAPFSGSGVAAAGLPRRPGQERRPAGGGGFARLRGGHQRLSQGARHRQDQPPACRPGQGSAPAQRRGPARSGAGGNRRRQRRGGPRRRPAGTRLAERTRADHQGHSGGPAGRARRGNDPLADRGNRGGETDHARANCCRRAPRRASRSPTCRASGSWRRFSARTWPRSASAIRPK